MFLNIQFYTSLYFTKVFPQMAVWGNFKIAIFASIYKAFK